MSLEEYINQVREPATRRALQGILEKIISSDLTSLKLAGKIKVVTVATTLTRDDNGKTVFLNAAAGFTVTLPPLATTGSGFTVTFIVKAAPTSGSYVITENATYDTDMIITNGINELEVDTGDDGPYSALHTTITFAANVAVAGDRVRIDTDGTYWYATGQTNADGGVTLA